jgi:hypothetical protein
MQHNLSVWKRNNIKKKSLKMEVHILSATQYLQNFNSAYVVYVGPGVA